ncbi:MAG: tryptophan synthase subunit alpha, partial [Candidatus Dormibacteria bacterium]
TEALRNGMTLHLAIEQINDARQRGVTIPLAPMTYINPVLAYGIDAFVRDAYDAGADGVIVPDLPADESATLRDAAHGAGLALIPLVAPTTTPERLARVCAGAAGFLYCVSVTGVTGAREALAPEAMTLLDSVRHLTALPRALGFGLHTHEHLERLRGRAEAAVVGSGVINAIDGDREHPVEAAERFLRSMLAG